MKKKIFVFVMLIMCVASVSAQWSVTPEIGMATIKKGGGIPRTENVWNAGWKAGVGVEYGITSGFSLKSGLYYAPRGHSFSTLYFGNYGNYQGEFDEEGTVSSYSVKRKRHFLQVPLMANFSIKLSDDIRLNLAAGPYIGFSMGDNISSIIYTYELGSGSPSNGYGFSGDSYEGWSNDHPFDWGISAQVGVEVKQMVVNFGYDASLGKEFDGGPVDMKYNTFSLSVGYKFKLGK